MLLILTSLCPLWWLMDIYILTDTHTEIDTHTPIQRHRHTPKVNQLYVWHSRCYRLSRLRSWVSAKRVPEWGTTEIEGVCVCAVRVNLLLWSFVHVKVSGTTSFFWILYIGFILCSKNQSVYENLFFIGAYFQSRAFTLPWTSEWYLVLLVLSLWYCKLGICIDAFSVWQLRFHNLYFRHIEIMWYDFTFYLGMKNINCISSQARMPKFWHIWKINFSHIHIRWLYIPV